MDALVQSMQAFFTAPACTSAKANVSGLPDGSLSSIDLTVCVGNAVLIGCIVEVRNYMSLWLVCSLASMLCYSPRLI